MLRRKPKILFLYTELAEYFIACVKELSKKAEVFIVHWPINKEAPFKFNFPDTITTFEKNNLHFADLQSLVTKEIDPDIIICSGWIDRDYIKLVNTCKKSIPKVLSMDNHWNGSIKQKLASKLGKLTKLKSFTHSWVPGKPQLEYAVKLGFSKEKILLGFYCADTEKFNQYYHKTFEKKHKAFPKRILYVGRYIEAKGIKLLWKAFANAKKTLGEDWELWCLGKGDIEPIESEGIKHFGFVQPKDMAHYIENTSIFVLPSQFEPWGVVVQEYATAGFPIICSNAVGAASRFLKDGENGYSFKTNNIKSLEESLKKMMSLNQEGYVRVSKASHQIGMQHTPQVWSETILSTLNSSN